MESRLAVCVILILALVVGGGRAQLNVTFQQSMRQPTLPSVTSQNMTQSTPPSVTSQQTTSQPIRRSLLEVCGKAPRNWRIVGGSDAVAGSWPWMATVRSSSGFCGGTLINNEWILSAAHCFRSSSPSSVTVYLGRQNQQGSNPNEVSRSVSRIIIHPNWNSDTLDNDIALLKLSINVRFTDYIRPVCLAAKGSAFSAGSTTWVTGWGRINTDAQGLSGTLQEVEVPIVSDRICKSFYKYFTDNMICAGREGKGPCFGDSGGPMVVKRGERWIQVGVNSFTSEEGCAIRNNPDGYTCVSPYQTWIEEHITSNQPGFVYSSSNVISGRYLFPLLLLSILHLVFYL